MESHCGLRLGPDVRWSYSGQERWLLSECFEDDIVGKKRYASDTPNNGWRTTSLYINKSATIPSSSANNCDLTCRKMSFRLAAVSPRTSPCFGLSLAPRLFMLNFLIRN